MGGYKREFVAQNIAITALLLLGWCQLCMASAGVAWVVQVSDLHLSDYSIDPTQLTTFGDRLGDLHLFSKLVLKALRPGAVLFTGDLTDAKSPSGVRQSLTEWEAYRSVISSVVDTGLPETHVLDLRGNHDTFAVAAREGSDDYFPKFAAAGRRNGSARVYLRKLSAAAVREGDCPAVLLVGIDTTPDPGLCGTNFMGRANAELLEEFDALLSQSKAGMRKQGCSCPVVAYGHYPLGVIAHPDTQPWWAGARRPKATLAHHKRTIKALLAHHNVSTYLNGHLHGAFGQRLHAMHRAGASGRYLLELETTAWKDDRRFRVLAIDNGDISFVDLSLNTPTKPASTASTTPLVWHTLEGWNFSISPPSGYLTTQQIVDNVVLITYPPDRRYSPLAGESRSRSLTVRALVLPVVPGSTNEDVKVQLVWKCQPGHQNPTGKAPMERVAVGEPLWEVPWLSEAACVDALTTIQVVASDGSTSEERPFADSGKLPANGQRHLPLGLGLWDQLRSVAIWSNWPHESYKVMLGLWCLHFFGLLLLPRLLLSLGLPTVGIDVQSKGWPARILLSWLLYPLTALCDMASVQPLWVPQVIYSAYLFVGPWMRARLLVGEPAGFLFLGRILLIEKGRFKWQHNPDTAMFSTVQMSFVLLPLTLWLATVTSRWLHHGQLPSKGWRPWRYLNQLQLLVLIADLYISYTLGVRFARRAFGVEALWFGPGMAWTIPLLAALLIVLYSRQGQGIARDPKQPARAGPKRVEAKGR